MSIENKWPRPRAKSGRSRALGRSSSEDRAARALRVGLFLGVALLVVAALSGCDLNYLPLCTTQCTAAGGNDTFQRGYP